MALLAMRKLLVTLPFIPGLVSLTRLACGFGGGILISECPREGLEWGETKIKKLGVREVM